MRQRKWLTILGAIVLLGSWMIEKTLHEEWDSRQRSLQRAEFIYLIFLASSFTMDALPDSPTKNQFNDMNFRTGLSYMAQGLPEDMKAKFESKISSSSDLNAVGTELMKAIEHEAQIIKQREGFSRLVFMALYVLGTVLILISEIFNSDKSSHTNA